MKGLRQLTQQCCSVTSYEATHTLHISCFQHSFPPSCISSRVLSKLLLPFVIICTSSSSRQKVPGIHHKLCRMLIPNFRAPTQQSAGLNDYNIMILLPIPQLPI